MSVPPSSEPDPIDVGLPGASARREHARRRANRERRLREKHPRIGGALWALADDPHHERAWATGGHGEEQVAESLAKRLKHESVVLHDRCIPGSRANVDHIAIAASGVWVIDAKRYKGKVEVRKPLFGDAKLVIRGSDKTKLIDGLAKQVELVRAAVADDSVPVHGALCFLDTSELPTFRTLTFDGFYLVYRKRLAKLINADGPLEVERIEAIARELSTRFPRA